MPDFDTVSEISASSIAFVNGTPIDLVESINANNRPPISSSAWLAGSRSTTIAYAQGNDWNSNWTSYSGPTDGGERIRWVVYGRNSDGNRTWLMCTDDNSEEIISSSTADPPTNSGDWTVINAASSDGLRGGAFNSRTGKWILCGKMQGEGGQSWKYLQVSTDGINFSAVDISSLTDISTSDIISIACDGVSTWVFGQRDRLYKSVDDGNTWTLAKDFNDGRTIKAVVYHRSRWLIAYSEVSPPAGGGGFAATSTDLNTWSVSSDEVGNVEIGAAAGNGVYIVVAGGKMLRSTNGTSWTLTTDTWGSNSIGGAVGDVATDGIGNWVVCNLRGRIFYSTDDGETWSQANIDSSSGDSGDDWECIAPAKILPHQ